jgi:hypothetical protein
VTTAIRREPDTRHRIASAKRRNEKPLTKAGQIRALWPEITAAIAAGQSIKSICTWLNDDAGIAMGLTSLTSQISRIRCREKQRVRPQIDPAIPPPWKSTAAEPNEIRKFDPLANIRASKAKRTGFDYRPVRRTTRKT